MPLDQEYAAPLCFASPPAAVFVAAVDVADRCPPPLPDMLTAARVCCISLSLPLSLALFLPQKVLLKINELQTHNPKQFEELGLPLSIKRLAWETDAKTFVRIASPHAQKYLASEFSPKMVLSSQQVNWFPRHVR